MTTSDKSPDPQNEHDDDRRKFLAVCGKFALITPPALTVLLSTSLNSAAIAHSSGSNDGGSGGSGGSGNSGHSGDHGNSGGDRHGGDRHGGDFWGWLERLLNKLF
jgi:uncharacterized membrane protein